MRSAWIHALIDLARTDRRIFLLVGDVGFSLVEPFAQEFPDRFVNIGVAEQNMIGIAAGLALSGKNVFVYSLANFPTMRCLEQIRNDVCYHNVSVKIVAGGSGLSYGALGSTHHVTEDLALMRAMPNMTVVAPGDPIEAALATRAIAEQPAPCYLRLVRTGDPVIHQTTPPFRLGQAIKIRDGDDITLIATGGILLNAVQAAEQLARLGIQSRVLSMHTIKPLDTGAVLAAASETGVIVTIEEHSLVGGLGSAVAEVLAEGNQPKVTFMRMGIPDEFCPQVGSQEYLRKIYSLSVEGIVSSVQKLIKKKASRL